MEEYRTVVNNNPNKNISVLLHTTIVLCQTSLLLFNRNFNLGEEKNTNSTHYQQARRPDSILSAVNF
jgi:hypothetical protein